LAVEELQAIQYPEAAHDGVVATYDTKRILKTK
jgi:hypothetical protein